MIATACLAVLLAASTIYCAVLQSRLERATAFAFAGMESVSYVCRTAAHVLRTTTDRSARVLRLADACTNVPEEFEHRRTDLITHDFEALADRIERHMAVGLLPIWGARAPKELDERYRPKGLRDD
jgi:hypothetical protein